MTCLTFCLPVQSYKRVPCPAVVKQRGVPGGLGVALLATTASELVQVRVCMTLVAVPVGPFILTLYPMAVCAEQVIVYPFQFKPCLFLMIKGLRLPVKRSMTLAAILVKLAFMYIFMAINASLVLGLILLLLMAFIALCVLMLANKGVLGIAVVVKGRLLPVFRIMTFLAEAAQFLLMNIFLLVATQAFFGGLAVFPLCMTFIALGLFMLSAQLE